MIENCHIIENGHIFCADRNAEGEIRQAVMLLRKNGFIPQSISTVMSAQTAVKISLGLVLDDLPSIRILRKKTVFENSWMEKL